MDDSGFDRAGFWPAPRAPGSFALQTDGLRVRELPEIPQALVSGDLDGFLAAEGLAPAVGLLGAATGTRYAVRLARQRLLAVGWEPDAAGWDPRGWGVTPMGAALAILAIEGPRWPEFFARATPIDPAAASPSAAFLMGDGLSAILTRHDGPDSLRLHVSRPLLPGVQDWLTTCGIGWAPQP